MFVIFWLGASFTSLASLLVIGILVTSLARPVAVQGSPTLALALGGICAREWRAGGALGRIRAQGRRRSATDLWRDRVIV